MRRGATWLNRTKPRPFVLATGCGTGTPGTLIYGSTQEAEAHTGAVAVYVDPRQQGVNRNGLDKRTAFYPGILIRERYERLPSHAGSVGASLAPLRSALRTALGVGTGSCLSDGAPPGSYRGRVVQIERKLALALRTRFAVILTQPQYSMSRHYQLVVPLRPDEGMVIEPAVLRLSPAGWTGLFSPPTAFVLVPIPLVHSVWHGRDIVRETRFVVDEATLAEIDRRLCEFFSLDPPP